MQELAEPAVSFQQGRQCGGTAAHPNHANVIHVFTQPATTTKM